MIPEVRRLVRLTAAIAIVSNAEAASAQNPQQRPQEIRVTSCDTYAASDLDPDRSAQGVPYDELNPALAIPACEDAVGNFPNSPRLIYQLGRAYTKRNDFKSAIVQFRKAASQGYAPAQYDLGVMYERGKGSVKDEAQAAIWYRKAADQGYAFAQVNLASLYHRGRGVARDDAEALKWFRKAAEEGNTRALLAVGLMYAAGLGVTLNYVESAKWFRKAADQGVAEAQRLLGVMYEHGEGVERDLSAAATLYRQAARQGDVEAQAKLDALGASGTAGKSSNEAVQSPPSKNVRLPTEIQKRVANCGAMRLDERNWTADERSTYRRDCWERAEADNGAVLLIDLGLIQSFASGATTVVYRKEGDTFNPMNLERWYFTCEGHFRITQDEGLGAMIYAPPRSVAAHISEIVCGGANVGPHAN